MIIRFARTLFLLAAMAFLPLSAHAEDREFSIINTYNQYTTALISVRLCDQETYANDAERARVERNFQMVRISAGKALQIMSPDLTPEQNADALKSMDDRVGETLNRFYTQIGCDHEVLQAGITWFGNFKAMPPFPE